MTPTLMYYLIGTYIAVLQALFIGLIISLVDQEFGLITAGVVLGWQLIGLVYARIVKR